VQLIMTEQELKDRDKAFEARGFVKAELLLGDILAGARNLYIGGTESRTSPGCFDHRPLIEAPASVWYKLVCLLDKKE
jgi:hypothetical protein